MANEEQKSALLALTPLFLHSPPFVQTPQLLYLATESAGTNSALTEVASSAAALMIMDACQPEERRPRPQQGGRRITVQYLQSLPDTEAQWAFRCVPHKSTV